MIDHLDGQDPPADAPLDPWMQSRVAQAMTPADDDIPDELMWARIVRARAAEPQDETAPAAPSVPARAGRHWALVAGVAAVLVAGIGIGRFLMPGAATIPPLALAPTDRATAPAPAPASPVPSPEPRSPMADHLQHTVTVLAAVSASAAPLSGDSVPRAELRRLLRTTRQLLDDPMVRDPRTHRLLEDLELVLAQLARVRSTAPATGAAADEALRETNLLPRLKAAAVSEARTASEEY